MYLMKGFALVVFALLTANAEPSVRWEDARMYRAPYHCFSMVGAPGNETLLLFQNSCHH